MAEKCTLQMSFYMYPFSVWILPEKKKKKLISIVGFWQKNKISISAKNWKMIYCLCIKGWNDPTGMELGPLTLHAKDQLHHIMSLDWRTTMVHRAIWLTPAE